MRKMKDSRNEYIKDIPEEWRVVKLKRISDSSHPYPIGDGDHGQISPNDYIKSGIPYIRVQNLTWGEALNLEDVASISDEVNQQNKKSILHPGDILIAKTGATIGKTAIIPDNIAEANTTSSVGKITVDKKYNNKYVFYCIISDCVFQQMWRKAEQKSAQPGFNIVDLEEFLIPLPDNVEQSVRIADYLDFLGANNELLKNLYRLEKGSGVLSFSGAPHGVIFKTPNYIDTFSLAERIEINNDFINLTESQKAASFFECQFCPDYLNETKCCIKTKQQARQIVQEFIFREGNPYEWNYYNRDKEMVDFFKQSRERKMFLVTKELNKRFRCRNYCSFIQWVRACNLVYETSFTPNDIALIIQKLSVESE